MRSGQCKTFTTFCAEQNDKYLTRGCKVKLKRALMISVWCEWFQRTDFDATLGCKMCDPEGIGKYPCVIVDGTDQTCASHYCDKIYTPVLTQRSNSAVVKLKYASSTRMVKKPSTRKKLERWVVSNTWKRRVDGKMKPLKVPELSVMRAYLRRNDKMSQFLDWALAADRQTQLPRLLYPVLRHSFGAVNVLGMVHPKIIDKMVTFGSLDWDNEQSLFLNKSAPLCKLIRWLVQKHGTISEIPAQFVDYMELLGERAAELRSEYRSNRYTSTNPNIDDEKVSEEDAERMADYSVSGADYCCRLCRYRLPYSIDNRRDLSNDTLCTKNYNGKKSMTSAFMIARCPHGVALWTHICKTAESVDDVASGIMCTLPVAPERVLYDNACALAGSCWVREYDYWENTVFNNDENHSKCHKCGAFFSCKCSKDMTDLLANLNDNAAEQGNKLLLTIRMASTFMSARVMLIVVKACLEADKRDMYKKYGHGVAQKYFEEALAYYLSLFKE